MKRGVGWNGMDSESRLWRGVGLEREERVRKIIRLYRLKSELWGKKRSSALMR